LFTEGVGGGNSDDAGAPSAGAAAAAAAPQPAKKKQRKSAAAAASDTTIPVPVLTGIQWSWQSSNGGVKTIWTPYSATDNTEIEAVWVQHGSAGEIRLSNGYNIAFGSMEQHPTNQPHRRRSVQRSVTATEVTARQADGHGSIALYSDHKRSHQVEPDLFAKAGTKMTVLERTDWYDAEWLRVKWQKTAKNTVEGWVKSRNVTAVPDQANVSKAGSQSNSDVGNAKKKKKTAAHNPFAAKKVTAQTDSESDDWEVDDDIAEDQVQRTSSAAAAAADMAMDIAEDGIPDATQFLLAAVAPPKLSAAAAAKYCKDRGLQPPKLAVPKDGEELVLGRGLHGITDPYMSSRQASLRVVQTSSGKAVLEFRALGRNACLYRKASSGSQSSWEKLSGATAAVKAATHASEAAQEAGSVAVTLGGGDELCLLADKTMRYKVVAAGVDGEGVNRSLTRSLTE
jgi:hypothetical protein